jgi:hypothetical protein
MSSFSGGMCEGTHIIRTIKVRSCTKHTPIDSDMLCSISIILTAPIQIVVLDCLRDVIYPDIIFAISLTIIYNIVYYCNDIKYHHFYLRYG